jgi:hypothetical protein
LQPAVIGTALSLSNDLFLLLFPFLLSFLRI